MVGDYYYGTGRRKSAVARVFLKQGKGQFIVNGKPVDEFFGRETGRMVVRQPLELTKNLTSFDIMVNVYGGGESGQAEREQQAQPHAASRPNRRCRPASSGSSRYWMAWRMPAACQRASRSRAAPAKRCR